MQKLHPRVVWLFFIRRLLILSVFPIFITLYIIPSLQGGEGATVAPYTILSVSVIINVTILFWFIFAFIWARLSYGFYGYTFSDISFQKKFGVFMKRTTTIPYETIEHIDTRQGILARLLGLTELYIETSGKHKKSEKYLPGLSQKAVEELKKELTEQAHKTKSVETLKGLLSK